MLLVKESEHMRKISGIFVLLSLLVAYTSVPAQSTFSNRKKAPRAVGVFEFDAAGHPRILPVSLYMDRKFYDAGLYMSKPAPVTLDSETVYEVVKSGVPQGLFTVEEARRVGDKVWWGEGKWKPYHVPEPPTKEGDKKKPAVKDDDDEDRPVLKKPKADDSTVVLHTEKGSHEAVDVTPRKEAPAGPPPDDSDRPLLRRVRPEPSAQKDEPIKFVTKLPGTEEFTPAVSDSDPPNGRPYGYAWSDSDREMLTANMKVLAAAELRKELAARRWPVPAPKASAPPRAKTKPGTKPAAPIAADPLVSALTDVKVAAYDLDYNNSPQIILTVRYMPPVEGLTEADKNLVMNRHGIVVTVVGRVNFEDKLQQIFAEVSDPRQLENHPEMAFVDAVDVDGDGRGELLFQRITPEGRGFVIYRVAGQSIGELFATTPR
jgi:hypothetical protein